MMRVRLIAAIGAMVAVLGSPAGQCEQPPANPGLVEALDAIVREACEYWADEQFGQMHEMLVKSVGAPGLRKLGDGEREALLASFRRRVESMWRLRADSLELQVALADLAWRLDCLFQRASLTEEQVTAISGQAKTVIAELADTPRAWAGGPYKYFLEDVVKEAQAEAERAVGDPLNPGMKRVLTDEETQSIQQRMEARWKEELPRLEERLAWIDGQKDAPNPRSLQAMACESALRTFLTEARSLAEARSRPEPRLALVQLVREVGQRRPPAVKTVAEAPKRPEEDAVARFAREFAERYRPVVRRDEMMLAALDMAILFGWLTGGETMLVP